MANSGFVGESVLLVSSLSVLIILLVVAAIFVAVYTDGQSKVSFHFQSCLLVSAALNHLVSRSQTLSNYARLYVNSVLCIDYCHKKSNYPPSAKYEHVQKRSSLFEHEK